MDFTMKRKRKRLSCRRHAMNDMKSLEMAEINRTYIIRKINTDDEELKSFLFTLGCYAGEEVTVISILSNIYIIRIKDARYSIDRELARAIVI